MPEHLVSTHRGLYLDTVLIYSVRECVCALRVSLKGNLSEKKGGNWSLEMNPVVHDRRHRHTHTHM